MKRTRRFLRKLLSVALSIQLMAMAVVPVFAVEASETTFQNDGFTYTVLTEPQEGAPGTVSLTDGRSKVADLKELSIAETVINSKNEASYTVTAIGERALGGDIDGMNKLQEVTIPASITEIEARAFSDQSKLQTLNFAENSALQSIGNNAFDSTALKTVVLPDQVKTLGNSVFSNCRSLTSVTMPASLNSIGSSLFSYCNYLKSIEVKPGGESYASENGVLFNQDKTKLIQYPVAKTGAEYTVPATVTSIEGSAFDSVKNLVEITLPDGLQTIGRAAFQKMGSLETVNFGTKLQTIGYMAFYNCRNLGAVTIPASVTNIDGYAFGGCSNASFTVASEAQKKMLTKAGASADAITVQAPAVSEFVENGITYKVTDEAAVQVGNGVDAMKEAEGNLTIPQNVSHDGKTYTVTAVADNAFARASKLTGLTLPETVEVIGERALAFTGLTSFQMPNSVKTLGKSAMTSCSALAELTISKQLTEIPESAFWGTAIKTLVVPEGVKTIGVKAFNSCPSLLTVQLPASLETIQDSAFWSNEALREVTIAPDSKLKTIEQSAFAFDAALKSINLPDTMQVIGDKAFSHCTVLKEIGLTKNNQLTTLGENAFSYTAVTSFHFNASLNTVGNRPLDGCSKLTEITVADGNLLYKSVDGVLLSKDGKTLVLYPAGKKGTAYTTPAGVTAIGEYAFQGVTRLNELTVSEGVQTVGKSAFKDCSNLYTVTLADSVNSLGYLCFYNCPALETVKLPADLTTLGNYTFYNCPALTEMTVPAGVKTYAKQIFGACSNLETLELLSTEVESIAENAFSGVAETVKITVNSAAIKDLVVKSGIPAEQVTVKESTEPSVPTGETFEYNGITYQVTSETTVQVGNGTDTMTTVEGVITIPETVQHNGKTYTVTAVADKAFWRVGKLTGLNLPGTIVYLGEYSMDTTGLKTFEMPNSVTTLGKSVLSSCADLSSVTLSNQLTEIPEGAFWGAGIKTIEIPEGVKTIGNRAFNSCANLQTVKLPASLETIDAFAFWSNEALREVTIAADSKLQSIGESAFAFDNKLTSINLPDTLKVVEKNSFANCNVLKSIGLTTENQLTTLGENAFGYTALETFHYAASLKTVGERPLRSCEKLQSITVAADNTLFKSLDGVLMSKDGKTLVQYPGAKKGTSYTTPAGVTAIGDFAFEDVKRINTLTISDGVLSIGKNCFKDCSNLMSLTMADSITSLGYLCVYNCPALEEIALPAGLQTMDKFVIYNCESLQSITVPAGVTGFEEQVFGACPNLETVELQSVQVNAVAKGAFKGTSPDVQITVTSEAIKNMVVESGIAENQVSVKEGTVPPSPVPTEDVFTVNQVTYKVLTQPAGSQKGTVSVGDGRNGLTATGVVTIPSVVSNDGTSYTVVAVSSNAMKNTNITELRLPDTVEVLEEAALKDAPALKTFTIPSGLKTIGINGVADCLKLKSINYAPNSSLTTLGNGAFAGNSEIETIELPNTITTMGTHTMFWNNKLRTVTFQEGFALTELPEGTFMRDFALEKIIGLPALTKIGNQCFYHCESLKQFDLSQVTELGEQAFYNCYALESISLSDDLTVLESGAFYGCRNLKQVKLSENLTDLGSTDTSGEELPQGVFQNCTSLVEIELPASVRVIGRDCFQGCTSLKKITILAPELTEIGANALYELHENVKIYVVNEQVKNFVVKEALLEPDSVIVMEELPEQPEEALKLEAMGNGGIGRMAKAIAVNKTGYFLVQITTASGANSIYTVPVPASGELPISYMEGCSITVWLTTEIPNLTIPTPNAGGAILGSASL